MVSKIRMIRVEPQEFITKDENGNDLTFILRPLRNRDFLKVQELADESQRNPIKREEFFGYFIKKCIEADDPDTTLEDIKDMPLPVMLKLLNACSQVNGMGEALSFQQGGQVPPQSDMTPEQQRSLQTQQAFESIKARVMQKR